MEFGLSEQQVLLTDMLHRYLSDHAPLERVRRFAEQGEMQAEYIQRGCRDLGINGLIIAEGQGGSGLGLLDAALVAEVLGRHVTPLPFAASAVMVPLALQLAGSSEQQQAWLPRLAAGEITAGAALGHTLARRTVAAGRESGIENRKGKLSGSCLSVLDYPADLYLVADNAGTLYLLPADTEKVNLTPLKTIDKTRHFAELVLQECVAQPLAAGDRVSVIEQVRNAGQVMLAADTLGAAQEMLDQAVSYAGQRQQFGRVIGSFQAVKHLCAEMAASLEPCRAMVWYAAHALDRLPQEAAMTACHTKAHVSEVATFVAKTATEVHGGMGFTDLLGLHYWFKRIGVNRQLLGSPAALREMAARHQSLIG